MNMPLRVLLIEDNPDYVSLVQQWLAVGTAGAFVLSWTNCLEAGLSHLKQFSADVILLDLGLPDSGGLETFRRVKLQSPNVPVIVLSGDNSEDLALQLARASPRVYVIYKSSSHGETLVKAIQDAAAGRRTSVDA